jgi:hypothetical protein
MVSRRHGSDSGQVHNGPFLQSARTAICCGGNAQVVALSPRVNSGARVEMLRCSSCDTCTWHVDGQQVERQQALGVLSAMFTSDAPRPAPRRALPRPAAVRQGHAPSGRPPMAASANDLAALLSGWQVLGAEA